MPRNSSSVSIRALTRAITGAATIDTAVLATTEPTSSAPSLPAVERRPKTMIIADNSAAGTNEGGAHSSMWTLVAASAAMVLLPSRQTIASHHAPEDIVAALKKAKSDTMLPTRRIAAAGLLSALVARLPAAIAFDNGAPSCRIF